MSKRSPARDKDSRTGRDGGNNEKDRRSNSDDRKDDRRDVRDNRDRRDYDRRDGGRDYDRRDRERRDYDRRDRDYDRRDRREYDSRRDYDRRDRRDDDRRETNNNRSGKRRRSWTPSPPRKSRRSTPSPPRRKSRRIKITASITDYVCLDTINEGVFGLVTMGKAQDGSHVAVKRLKVNIDDNDGTYVREIENLKLCNHPNVIKLLEVCTNVKDEVFLVMEYCEYDLKTMLKETTLEHALAKNFLQQLLRGIEHMHSKDIIHRDLKPANIMVNLSGVLKIVDLGSSRVLDRDPMTPDLVTLRYRAPEILLGETRYTTAIDMWSIGNIFSELLTGKPVLDGTSELEQIDKMVNVIGSPSDSTWPGFEKLPHAKQLIFPTQPKNRLEKYIPNLSNNARDLMNRMLTYDPKSRISASDSLSHVYFTDNDPAPAPMGTLPELIMLDNIPTAGGIADF